MHKSKLKLEIRPRRCFSSEFKKNKVKELIEKRITVMQLSRLYGVTRSAVYKWLYRYSVHYKQSTTLVIQMESESYKTQRLLQRVSELERTVGQKQLELDFLNKLFEIASEEMGYDLKKNLGSKLLSGTDTTPKDTPTK